MSVKVLHIPFRANSRLPLLLGDELIPDAGYSVFELVKNAHDADATVAIVELHYVDNIDEGKIVVEDDGHGMDLKTLKEAWTVLGTTNRRSLSKDGKVSPKYSRPFLGEKGIGRFAAHKLGDVFKLTTRRKDNLEYVVEIDWRNWDPENPAFLEDVPTTIFEREPQLFEGVTTGTRIEITGLREAWTRGQVRNLHRDINSISSPFAKKNEFEAVLTVIPHKHWLDRLISYEHMDELALFKAKCTINGDTLKYNYEMRDIPALKESLTGRKMEKELPLPPFKPRKDEENEDVPQNKFSTAEYSILKELGAVELHLLMFDLTPDILRLVVPHDKTGFRKYLSRNGGIRVYRAGIRVFGLGGAGEDWLNLGGRRVSVTCIQTQQ